MKHFARRGFAAIAFAAALSSAACTQAQLSQFQAGLTKVNIFATTYGPIVGKDLIMVSNIIVQAECSPLLGPATATAGNVLNIVAPNSSAAQKVGTALNTNFAVAQQLCPLVTAIAATVGKVPSGTPSQIIPTPAS